MWVYGVCVCWFWFVCCCWLACVVVGHCGVVVGLCLLIAYLRVLLFGCVCCCLVVFGFAVVCVFVVVGLCLQLLVSV